MSENIINIPKSIYYKYIFYYYSRKKVTYTEPSLSKLVNYHVYLYN